MNKKNFCIEIQDNAVGGFDLAFTLSSGELKVYHFVFCDRGDAEAFVELIDRMDVSEVHIFDVLEDALP